VEVWTRRGLQRFLVLFFLDLSTRQVEIAGLASTANGLWMGQVGRKVTDAVDGILLGKRSLIHDRDPLFTAEFLNLLAGVGVESVKLLPRSPNLNAYASYCTSCGHSGMTGWAGRRRDRFKACAFLSMFSPGGSYRCSGLSVYA
jgi:hypothetical protein